MRKEIIIDENRGFKGEWIDSRIFQDNNLTRTEKDCLVEIISLCGQGNCFASNQHFANYLGVAKGTAANIIYSLRKKGYIGVNLTYKKGSKEVDKRFITYLDPYSRKNEYPIHSKMNTYSLKNEREEYILSDTEEENTNKDNQKHDTGNPCHASEIIPFPDIELENNQWHWKSDKQYKDYIEKIMPKYICEIVHDKGFEKTDNAIRVLTRVISTFYYYYRINKGEYHPWYRKEDLRKCIDQMFAYGLSENGEGNISTGMAETFIKQFFSHKNMSNDYHLSVFATTNMLDILDLEIMNGRCGEA